MATSAEVVIVGAGFAGAATAYALARRGVRDVLLLESQALPGTQASGRNAAMARFVVTRPDALALALEGIRFIQHPPPGFARSDFFRCCGSLMLMERVDRAAFDEPLRRWREHGIDACWLEADEVERRVPATAGGSFAGAISCSADGVVDVAALLEAYLRGARGAGARLLTGQRVVAVSTQAGRICAVETERERIDTRCVVNAAGCWANAFAELAGVGPMPLRPLRRHLAVTSAPQQLDRSWPFVWDVSHEIYFRPEPPGLLMSPCDATELAPGEAPVDLGMIDELAEKATRWFPRLANLEVRSLWAGLRTMTPDGSVVVGRDPRLEGFVWCAGLGGNGVATSSAVGRLAAEAVLGAEPFAAHAPQRFLE